MKSKLLLIILLLPFSCSFIDNESREESRFISGNDYVIVEKYNNDTLLSQIKYASDTQTRRGEAKFYKGGRLVKIENWDDNTLVGSFMTLESGMPTLFICHDSYGDTIFLRIYNGRQIGLDSGQILPHGILQLDNLDKDSTVEYAAFIVKPPYTSVSTESYIVDLISSDTIPPYKLESYYDWANYYTFKIIKPGKYKHIRITRIIDSLIDESKLITSIDTTIFYFPRR